MPPLPSTAAGSVQQVAKPSPDTHKGGSYVEPPEEALAERLEDREAPEVTDAEGIEEAGPVDEGDDGLGSEPSR
jgi:hypothetical protein